MSKIIKIIKPLFFFAITALIFYLIFRKVDYVSLKEVFLRARWWYLAPVASVIFLSLVFAAQKWQAVLRAMDYSISFKESFRMIMAAFPVSVITPAKSGDLIKAYYLKDKVPVSRVVGAVATERLIDIFVLAFYSFFGAIIFRNGLILIISLSIFFLIPLAFLIINKIKLPFPNLRQRIENFLYVSKIFIEHPKKLVPLLFYTLTLWLLNFLIIKFLFLSLGSDIPIFYIAAAFPLVVFISLLPITVAGMGTRDAAMIYFFGLWVGPSVSLGVGLLYAIFAYWLLALIGLPAMRKLL